MAVVQDSWIVLLDLEREGDLCTLFQVPSLPASFCLGLKVFKLINRLICYNST